MWLEYDMMWAYRDTVASCNCRHHCKLNIDLVLQFTGRTDETESLFTYDDGEDHASINDDSTYTPVFGVDPDSVPDNVKAACGDNRECLFDFAQTNDTEFAMSTMGEVEDQKDLRKILSKYCYCAVIVTVSNPQVQDKLCISINFPTGAVPPRILGPNTIRVTAGDQVTEKFESNGTLSLPVSSSC